MHNFRTPGYPCLHFFGDADVTFCILNGTIAFFLYFILKRITINSRICAGDYDSGVSKKIEISLILSYINLYFNIRCKIAVT